MEIWNISNPARFLYNSRTDPTKMWMLDYIYKSAQFKSKGGELKNE